jgi:pantoate kinase
MAMLGNTAFAFAYDEDAFRTLKVKELHIEKLNNRGIAYD